MPHIHRFLFLGLLFFTLNAFSQEKIELYDGVQYNTKGHEYLEQEEPDYLAAEKEFAKVHFNDTLYAESHYNRAYCFRMAGAFEKSLKIVEEGLELNKQYLPSYYINMATSLDSLGREEEAIKALDIAIKRFPYNYDLKVTKGKTLEEMHKFEAAKEIFETCILDEPLRAIHHLQMARLMYAANGITQAILPITTAIIMDPEGGANLSLLNTLDDLVSSNSNKKDNKEPHYDLSKMDEQFEDVEDLIKNYIALSDNYEIPGDIKYSFIKQLHLLLSEANMSQDGFFTKVYLNNLKPVLENEQYPEFAGLVSLSSESEKHQKYIGKNMDKIQKVATRLYNNFNDLGADKKAPTELTDRKVKYFYTEEGKLHYFGTYDIKKEYIVGPIFYLNENGSIDRKGALDSEGRMTGSWEWYYANGQLSRTSDFLEDQIIGETITYTEEGNTSAILRFKAGELDGKLERFKIIGHKYEEAQYINGKENGVLVGYYPDQSIYYKIPIKDDLKHGKYKTFYEDGALKAEGNYTEGKLDGSANYFFRDGKKDYVENFKDGERDGVYFSYHQNGQIHKEGSYKEGNQIGEWKTYNMAGKMIQLQEYDLKGKKNGLIKNLDYKGRISSEEFYKKGNFEKLINYDTLGKVIVEHKKKKKKIVFESFNTNGTQKTKGLFLKEVAHGDWQYHDAYGNLNSTTNYAEGITQGTVKEYYRNGDLYATTEYKDGLRDGRTMVYYPDGKLKSQYFYKNDELDGRYIVYNMDGKLSSDTYYTNGVLNGVCKYYDTDESLYSADIYDSGYPMSGKHFNHRGENVGNWKLINGAGQDEYFFDGAHKLKMGSNTYKGGSLNGPILRYHLNGNKRMIGQIVNDNRHGERKAYYFDGQIKYLNNYNYGQKTGIWKHYFQNGELRNVSNYEFDQLNGPDTFYYDNGQARRIYNYSYGSLEGPTINYDPSGALSYVIYREDNTIVAYSYHDSEGKLKPRIPIVNGSGNITAYFANGNKSASFTMKNGAVDGDYQLYHANGQLLKKRLYTYGKLNGAQFSYYNSGEVKEETNFYYHQTEGVQKHYYPSGKLKREENYKGDEQHGSTIEYDEQGNKTRELIYFGGTVVEIK